MEPVSGNAYEPNGTAPLPTAANGGFIEGTRSVFTDFKFNKNTATTLCVVEVYGPLPGTKYNIDVSCPT